MRGRRAFSVVPRCCRTMTIFDTQNKGREKKILLWFGHPAAFFLLIFFFFFFSMMSECSTLVHHPSEWWPRTDLFFWFSLVVVFCWAGVMSNWRHEKEKEKCHSNNIYDTRAGLLYKYITKTIEINAAASEMPRPSGWRGLCAVQ